MRSVKQLVRRGAKKILRRSIARSREATWRYRRLPEFLIIGAQKAGTTSLYYYLSQHPQLVPSFKKEVHFFDGGIEPGVDNFEKGEAWYRARFPLNWNLSDRQRTFEASPLYLFNPLAPKRIAELIPGVKLIAVLRNPTERAISHYFHERRYGRESLGIMEALQAEEERLRCVTGGNDYKSPEYIRHSYKSRGRYHEQIQRYLDYFPTSSVLLINSDRFFSEPHHTLRRVFQFVGVDPDYEIADLKQRNSGSRTQVDPAVYEYLNRYFEPHNEALYDLIGERYGW